jgi:hypothetical protein
MTRTAARAGRTIHMDGQDEQDEGNDECGVMNDESKASLSSFIIPHSSLIISLILPILSIHVNCSSRKRTGRGFALRLRISSGASLCRSVSPLTFNLTWSA